MPLVIEVAVDGVLAIPDIADVAVVEGQDPWRECKPSTFWVTIMEIWPDWSNSWRTL
jgi:hypothetical protein